MKVKILPYRNALNSSRSHQATEIHKQSINHLIFAPISESNHPIRVLEIVSTFIPFIARLDTIRSSTRISCCKSWRQYNRTHTLRCSLPMPPSLTPLGLFDQCLQQLGLSAMIHYVIWRKYSYDCHLFQRLALEIHATKYAVFPISRVKSQCRSRRCRFRHSNCAGIQSHTYSYHWRIRFRLLIPST